MKIKLYDAFYMLLSVANIILNNKFGMSYLVYLLAIMLILLRLGKKMDNETYLLYSLFIPDKYLQLLAVVLFLIFSNRIIVSKVNRREGIFIGYILIVGTINCFIYNGFYVSVIFQVGVYYCILRMIDYFNDYFSIVAVMGIFDKMFVLQVVAIILEYILTGQTMDSLTGTLISAHYLGIFLLVYVYMLWKSRYILTDKSRLFLRIVVSLICFYYVDAKHVLFIFIASVMLAKLLKKLNVKNRITFTMFGMTIFIAMTLFMLENGWLSSILNNLPTVKIYVLNNDYNKKFRFYRNTFEQLKGLNGILGFGVGQFGSQICLTFSKGIIYSWNDSLSNYTYAISPYMDAIKGIMTEWYTNYGIVMSSMVLGYPLVSYIGFIAELGLVGLFQFMQILDKKFKNDEVTFILMFIFLSNFDTYFEIPCVFIMLLIADSINRKSFSLEVKSAYSA